MNKLIISLAILIPLLITACKEAEKKAPVKPDYDFRDEQYQDFYSVQVRKFYKNKGYPEKTTLNSMWSLHLDSKKIKKYIEEHTNIKKSNSYPNAWLHIRRIAPENDTVIRDSNHFQNKEDVIAYYQQKSLTNDRFIAEPCIHQEQVEGLFCLRNKTKIRYFYLPQESKQLPYLDQSINFYCMPITKPLTEQNCTLYSNPDKPFNLNTSLLFTNPNNFFYVMPYAEKLIFNSTGEHVWQTSLKQN